MIRQISVWSTCGHLFSTFCILHSFIVGNVYCRTTVLQTPACFGVTARNFNSYSEHAFSFSQENAAVSVRSSDNGLILDAEKTYHPTTCILRFQISVNRAIDVIYTFLNHASLVDYGKNKTKVLFTLLVFFYQHDTRERVTLSQVIISSESAGLNNLQLDGRSWPNGVSTFYMTLESNESHHNPFGLHFSITMTPVYRCSLMRNVKPQSTSIKETDTQLEYYVFYQQGYIPCQEINSMHTRFYILCIPRSLLCDSHRNCPIIKGKSLDEPVDRKLCLVPRKLKKVDIELILGVLAVILILVMIFAMVFTIADYRSLYKRCRGHWASRSATSYDEQSIATEFSLPVAPPRYESVEGSGAAQRVLCKLCNPQTSRRLAYESPPSYTRDRDDETGVYPTFARPLYTRSRPRTRVGGQRSRLFRRRRTITIDGLTEDTRSLESWSVTYARTDNADVSADLPSYRDIAGGISSTRSNPTASNRTT
ncbi:hypothetical protein FBUS_04873 [Fasciolopsis buskii]|uniref:Uncharacterized protein n=1 Tax=Fasciolopsis buskii TaxID=27845 RepID=A0A8E0RRS2_9TREM|nr:hypothetical protein FBUS_04873 [Fasciolopsis buski]